MSAFFSFFAASERTFVHFTVSARMLTLLVWGICAGLAVGAFAAFFRARTAGAAARALLAAGAHTKETAKTPAELGLTRAAARALARDKMLSRMVKREGEGYFIPEEERYRAAVRFEKKDASPAALGLTLVLIAAAGVLAVKLLPVLLGALDAMLP